MSASPEQAASSGPLVQPQGGVSELPMARAMLRFARKQPLGTVSLGLLAVVVITAVIGTWLVRSQGRQALARLSSSFSDLRDPTQPLADGAMILFAGGEEVARHSGAMSGNDIETWLKPHLRDDSAA